MVMEREKENEKMFNHILFILNPIWDSGSGGREGEWGSKMTQLTLVFA